MQLPTLSNRLNTVLFSLLTVVALSRSEILSASANLSSTQYDFIIVGGTLMIYATSLGSRLRVIQEELQAMPLPIA